MGYEIIRESDGRGVLINLEGAVTAADMHAANEAIYSDDLISRLCWQIWDFGNAARDRSVKVSPDDTRALAIEDGYAANKDRVMLIALVGSQDYFSGLDRLYKLYADVWAEGVRCEVFRTVTQARKWIAKEIQKP